MKSQRNNWIGILFASPWILGMITFLAYPIVSSFYYSFTSFSILKPPVWIGLSNYQELIGDEVFRQAASNTLLLCVASVPLTTVMAICLALLLNTSRKGQNAYRTLFYIPSLVPTVALAVLWLWIFNGQYGLLNEFLVQIGLPRIPWLTDPAWAKVTLILISIWGCGNSMVIYLAGLQDVPLSLYEAADLDGANAWQKTMKVTLPMISPVIQFNVILGIIGSLQTFALPFVMFPGGQPARSTYVVAMYLYDNAFLYQRMGYASAMGWVLFLTTLILTLISLRLGQKHVHYGGSG
jgi:multiple sugar transport system permease protein